MCTVQAKFISQSVEQGHIGIVDGHGDCSSVHVQGCVAVAISYCVITVDYAGALCSWCSADFDQTQHLSDHHPTGFRVTERASLASNVSSSAPVCQSTLSGVGLHAGALFRASLLLGARGRGADILFYKALCWSKFAVSMESLCLPRDEAMRLR